jgi:hypothetical protein
VAALAERGEVAWSVIAGIMVQVCSRKDDARDTELRGRGDAHEPGLRT